MLRVRIRFLTLSQLVKWGILSSLGGFKELKIDFTVNFTRKLLQ